MVGDLLRGAGYAVLDMGPDMPVDSLQIGVKAAADVVAVAIACAVTGRDNALAATVDALRDVTDVPIVLGGHGVASVEHALELGADGFCAPGEDPVEVVQDLTA